MDRFQNSAIYSPIRRPYVWLLILSLILGSIAWISEFHNVMVSLHPQIQLMTTMLAVGIFSSYLTAVVVDGTFREKENREQRRMQNTALSELSGPLNSYLNLLQIWYRVSLAGVPESPPESITEVLGTREIEKIRMLDFSETYPIIGRGDDYTFLTHSTQVIERFQNDVDDIIRKYSPHMDPDLVNNLQELKNSDLFNLLSTPHSLMGTPQNGPLPLFAGDGYLLLQNNAETLEQLIRFYEDPRAPTLSHLDISHIWRDDEKPKIGSARMEITLERVRDIELSDEPPYEVLNPNLWGLFDSQEEPE